MDNGQGSASAWPEAHRASQRAEALERRVAELERQIAGMSSYIDEAAGRLSKEGCICHGNWRAIVRDSEPLIGKWFVDDKGARWNFFGPVHGGDDYYYGMIGENGKLALLSCVGSIEGWGYTLETHSQNSQKEKP
jgi:hypothetical protein